MQNDMISLLMKMLTFLKVTQGYTVQGLIDIRYICFSALCTVQTFNASTNRSDVSQTLVVQTPMDNM